MKATFVQKGPGVAEIRVALEGKELNDQSCTLACQRSSDQFYLAQNGGDWTAHVQNLELPCSREGDELVFQLGPEYVNYLERGNHRLTLQANGEKLGTMSLHIENVQPQILGGSGAMKPQLAREAQAAKIERDLAQEEPAQEIPEPQKDTVVPEPAKPEPEQQKTEPAKAEIAKAATVDAAAQKPKPVPAAGKTSSGTKAAIILAILVMICAGVGTAIYQNFYANKTAEEPVVENVPPVQEEQKEEEKAKPEEEPAPAQQQPVVEKAVPAQPQQVEIVQTAPQATARERARSFFANQNKTPQGAYELTKDLETTTPEQQDAAFRLLYYAISNNYAPAFAAYATCLDPTTPPWGTIQKDGATAWEYYKKAGTPEGAAAADKVLDWTKQNASSNAKAREWLQQMK